MCYVRDRDSALFSKQKTTKSVREINSTAEVLLQYINALAAIYHKISSKNCLGSLSKYRNKFLQLVKNQHYTNIPFSNVDVEVVVSESPGRFHKAVIWRENMQRQIQNLQQKQTFSKNRAMNTESIFQVFRKWTIR